MFLRLFQGLTLPRSLLPIVTCALCAISRLSAATYFIDYAAGMDSNVGTSTIAAWQHCPGDPAARGFAASTVLTGGDTVYFKGGVSYVLTGATGILLRTSGAPGAPITFDGNSSGSWGSGRAQITDNHGGNGVAAFSAPGTVCYLAFRTFDFGPIGGTATLPADHGAPVAPRFGAGLLFNAGVTNTSISDCTFHDLGYAFDQKPMNAPAITGIGIGIGSCDTLTISGCDFTHLGTGIEMANATSLANLTIAACTFHDAVCWSVDLPPPPVTPANFNISGCTESADVTFTPAGWTGYGPSPRTDVETVAIGSTVTLTVTAASSPAATFQWQKNGTPITGATGATLTLSSVAAADSATYTAIATNPVGSATSNDAILTVTSAPLPLVQPTDARLANLSVRSSAGTGSNTLIMGFVVSGTAPKSLLIRGVGPTLSSFGVGGALPDPVLALFSGSTLLASNQRWGTSGNAALIASTANAVNAFALPSGSADSALLPSLTAGAYTAAVTSAGGGAGAALIELYDPLTTPDSRLINASVRTAVTPTNSPIIGFVVNGTTSRRLLIRAIGPGLQTFALTGLLSDPKLQVYQGSMLIATNDNWGGNSTLVNAAKSVGAFPLNDPTSKDAMLILDAAPGTYSAVVSGVGAAQGVVLLDIYELP